jgi:hypothetical protein
MTRRNGTLIRELFANARFSSVIHYWIQRSIALQLNRTGLCRSADPRLADAQKSRT